MFVNNLYHLCYTEKANFFKRDNTFCRKETGLPQLYIVKKPMQPSDHSRRINTEEKAKVVTSVWEAEFIKFLAALAILPRTIFKIRMNSSFSFKSFWCNSSYNSYHPGQNSYRGKELNRSFDDICLFFCLYPSSMHLTLSDSKRGITDHSRIVYFTDNTVYSKTSCFKPEVLITNIRVACE